MSKKKGGDDHEAMFAKFMRESGRPMPPGCSSLADVMRAMGGLGGGGGGGAGGFRVPDSGGGAADFMPEASLREMHANALKSVKDAEAKKMFLSRIPGLDKTAAEHVCSIPVEALKDTAVARLPRDMPSVGKVATLTSISDAMYASSVGLLVKDSIHPPCAAGACDAGLRIRGGVASG